MIVNPPRGINDSMTIYRISRNDHKNIDFIIKSFQIRYFYATNKKKSQIPQLVREEEKKETIKDRKFIDPLWSLAKKKMFSIFLLKLFLY